MRQRLFYWFAVILWMIVIYSMSTNIGSSENSQSLLSVILHIFHLNISSDQFDQTHFLMRKTGHLSEYAVLGILLWLALSSNDGVLTNKRLKTACITILLSALYASTDEFHQIFVPNRTACVQDVFIDTCGAMLGVVIVWIFWSFQKSLNTRKSSV